MSASCDCLCMISSSSRMMRSLSFIDCCATANNKHFLVHSCMCVV